MATVGQGPSSDIARAAKHAQARAEDAETPEMRDSWMRLCNDLYRLEFVAFNIESLESEAVKRDEK